MARLSLGELNAQRQRIKKSIAELLALRIKVAQAERRFKSSRGSYEVCLPDSRPSRFINWNDVSSRRLDPDVLTGKRDAKPLARAEQDKLDLVGHG